MLLSGALGDEIGHSGKSAIIGALLGGLLKKTDGGCYLPFFARNFAQRLFCAAAMLALAFADNLRRLRVGLTPL